MLTLTLNFDLLATEDRAFIRVAVDHVFPRNRRLIRDRRSADLVESVDGPLVAIWLSHAKRERRTRRLGLAYQACVMLYCEEGIDKVDLLLRQCPFVRDAILRLASDRPRYGRQGRKPPGCSGLNEFASTSLISGSNGSFFFLRISDPSRALMRG